MDSNKSILTLDKECFARYYIICLLHLPPSQIYLFMLSAQYFIL